MPGTAHALTGNETFGQRTVIMGAMRADSENVVAVSHQQHLLVADMTEELAVDKIGKRDALGEVRALRGVCVLGHVALLSHCAPKSPVRSRDRGEQLPAQLGV